MNLLKEGLVAAPPLKNLEVPEVLANGEYSVVGKIIVACDASQHGWGGVLLQVDLESGKRRPCRFESGVWGRTEKGYDTVKKECQAVLRVFTKFRNYLYGIRFNLEVDAATLVVS